MTESLSGSEPRVSRPGGAFHHFTVDVEEYFHSTLLTQAIPSDTWDAQRRRSPALTDWILEQMDDSGAKGTFFVLGWLAEREPDLVRRIADAGHEVASHSWWHGKVSDLQPEEFREDIRRTRAVLEDIVGEEVVGFRAPSFSIRPGMEWAFDVLIEEGYRYDSSLFPIEIHPGYGYPDAEPDPYWIERPSGALLELPLLTLSMMGRRLPAAGGAYLRFFPAALPRRALNQAAGRGAPGMIYIHPWDLDPTTPAVPLSRLQSFRLRGGPRSARRRLRALLRRFTFVPIRETLKPRDG